MRSLEETGAEILEVRIGSKGLLDKKIGVPDKKGERIMAVALITPKVFRGPVNEHTLIVIV
jgi:hypothetical protein